MDFFGNVFEDLLYFIESMSASPQIFMSIIALSLIAITIRIRFFNIQTVEVAKQSKMIIAENIAGKVQQIAEKSPADYIDELNEIYRRQPVQISLKDFDWDKISDNVFELSTFATNCSNPEHDDIQDDSDTESD